MRIRRSDQPGTWPLPSATPVPSPSPASLGELFGKYRQSGSYAILAGAQPNLYFAGIPLRLQDHGNWVVTDRLGSARANAKGERFNYYPYGGEVGTETSEGGTKFATYQRDSAGLDYAQQRYYNQAGRFFSPDPMGLASVTPAIPSSWNRYAYASGDPVNRVDPTGMDDCGADWMTNAEESGPCGNPCNGPGMGSGFMPMPDPACYAPGGDGPVTGSTEKSWHMFVVAQSDCYTRFVGSVGVVWERDVNYYAYMVYDDGSGSTKLTGDGSTVIKETLHYISGQKPPMSQRSQSGKGQVFQDQYSVGNGGPFTETQTFNVIYQGTSYAAQIQGFTGSVSSSNSVSATAASVSINNDTNSPGGTRALCK
jgi:RHS repeat-associated protein